MDTNELTDDLLALGKRINRSYIKAEPSAEYRIALYQRLMREAHGAEFKKARSGGFLRTAAGVVALSVAGVAVALLKGRSEDTVQSKGE